MGIRFKNKGSDNALMITESAGQAEALGVKVGDVIVGYNDMDFSGHHLDFRDVVGSLPRPVRIRFERATHAFQVLKGDLSVKHRRPSVLRESVSSSVQNLQVLNSSHDETWVGPDDEVRRSFFSAEYVMPNPHPGTSSLSFTHHLVKSTVHKGKKIVLLATYPQVFEIQKPVLVDKVKAMAASFEVVEEGTLVNPPLASFGSGREGSLRESEGSGRW